MCRSWCVQCGVLSMDCSIVGADFISPPCTALRLTELPQSWERAKILEACLPLFPALNVRAWLPVNKKAFWDKQLTLMNPDLGCIHSARGQNGVCNAIKLKLVFYVLLTFDKAWNHRTGGRGRIKSKGCFSKQSNSDLRSSASEHWRDRQCTPHRSNKEHMRWWTSCGVEEGPRMQNHSAV